MADETAKPDRAAERAAKRGTQSNPDAEPEEVRYSVDELRDQAKGLLGVSPHAISGAFYGTDQKTFTLDQAKSRVDAFLNRAESSDGDA